MLDELKQQPLAQKMISSLFDSTANTLATQTDGLLTQQTIAQQLPGDCKESAAMGYLGAIFKRSQYTLYIYVPDISNIALPLPAVGRWNAKDPEWLMRYSKGEGVKQQKAVVFNICENIIPFNMSSISDA